MRDLRLGDPTGRSGDRPDARRRPLRFAAGLGLTLLISAVAYVSTLPLGAPTASRATDANSHPIGSTLAGVEIGQSAPDFIAADDANKPLLKDLDGSPIRIRDFAGRPLWIVFWATWCTPCQEEASDIRASYEAHRSDNLAVLAIDVQEPPAAVHAFALKHDLDYMIGLDPTAAVKAVYGGWALPTHFFVGGDGVIRDSYLGQLSRSLMELHLQSILGS
jgi:cytochrome c biogenesis protein CcmG, thiol:disulfide interchange protein DsbE